MTSTGSKEGVEMIDEMCKDIWNDRKKLQIVIIICYFEIIFTRFLQILTGDTEKDGCNEKINMIIFLKNFLLNCENNKN